MSTRNTLLFGAALAVTTAAIAYDHATHPVPPRPVYGDSATVSGTAPCAAAPCAAGAPVTTKRAAPPPPAAAPCAAGAPAQQSQKLAPPPPPAQRPAEAAPAAPPPPPRAKPAGEEAPDLVQAE